MMLSKCVSTRVFVSSIFARRYVICSFSSMHSLLPPTTPSPGAFTDFNSKEIALSFKDWFKCQNDILLDRIYEILVKKDDNVRFRIDTELALSRLGLKLSEEFVLKVLNHCINKEEKALNHGKESEEVLSCLKFFDWAGRQHGFNHTRATFNAIFKILSREKLMNLMLKFLDNFKHKRHEHKVRFYDTLVMGYAVAGKPEIALQLFGKMRFQGLDLDSFSYHVFFNALVEQSSFDVADVISNQITMRGLENEITSCLRVKNFVKQNNLEEAKAFLHGLESNGFIVNDHMLGILVDALCKRNKFEEAGKLLEDFWELRNVPMPNTYGVWIRSLVQAGNVDGAMTFLRNKQFLEGYLPDVFRFNILICRLLRENRLEEVCDLLLEMREGKIAPDKVTMNATLCFFCKAGMVDVALELYNSRLEFGLSLNSLAYNYLINTLCGDGSIDEAYKVLGDSIEQGYFPGKKTFTIIAKALIREEKLDKMINLIKVAVRKNMACDNICFELITALCKARRVEDGYLMHGELNITGKGTNRNTYYDLIHGFTRSNRGDMASKLLVEMQENGHSPNRKLYRAVIHSICTMDDPEYHFFTLLEMELSRQQPNREVYNSFIDGAGHAKKPNLARKVFERMIINGVEPHLGTKILMLQSYLRNERVADALNFFRDLCKNPARKLYNTILVGLCKANKPDIAVELLSEVKERGLVPSLEFYEELVRSYCSLKNYDMVVKIIQDMELSGRQASSYIGNILLFHSLTNRQLYNSFVRLEALNKKTSPPSSVTLRQLVGLFSGGCRVEPVDQFLENLDEVIEQCFPPDIFTYNILLRRLTMVQTMDYACRLFYKLLKKGYEPNQWTYDIIVHGLCKHGRRKEATFWIDKMQQEGYNLSYGTKQLI